MHARFITAAFIVVTIAAAWAAAQEAGRTVWDGVYSADQAESGKHRYSGQCKSCHGQSLDGGHIFGSRTRTAPALRGEAFLSHWIGHSTADLFNEIARYMPLDHPGTLSDDVNASILAFILQENGLPPGSQNLPMDTAVLQTIQITAQKK
jgi:hypothetical protein